MKPSSREQVMEATECGRCPCCGEEKFMGCSEECFVFSVLEKTPPLPEGERG